MITRQAKTPRQLPAISAEYTAADYLQDRIEEYINTHWESDFTIERFRNFAAWCRMETKS